MWHNRSYLIENCRSLHPSPAEFSISKLYRSNFAVLHFRRAVFCHMVDAKNISAYICFARILLLKFSRLTFLVNFKCLTSCLGRDQFNACLALNLFFIFSFYYLCLRSTLSGWQCKNVFFPKKNISFSRNFSLCVLLYILTSKLVLSSLFVGQNMLLQADDKQPGSISTVLHFLVILLKCTQMLVLTYNDMILNLTEL